MDPLQEDNPLNRMREIVRQQRFIADRTVRRLGITVEQGRMLGMVDALTLQTGKAPVQKDLAAISHTSAASVTSLLQGMEAKELLERRPSPEDSRRKTLHLLPRGTELLAQFDHTIRTTHDAVLAVLDPAENAVLLELLRRLQSALTEETT